MVDLRGRTVRAAPPAAADDNALLLAASVREPNRFTPKMLSNVARRLGTDLADDLAAETFLIAYRQDGRFDRRSGVVRGWLYGIANGWGLSSGESLPAGAVREDGGDDSHRAVAGIHHRRRCPV
ncbi:MAG TPA: sigma factor [Kribbella sp.]|nr:sigma factor [Kribbella sp.]